MTFGDRLTELRKDKGFTREAFAHYLGISKYTLRNYETNQHEPGHVFLKHIADIFKVSVDYLLCMTDDRTPNIMRVDFKIEEIEHIKKYRSLDPYGMETVDIILNRETERITKNQKEKDILT